MNELPALFSILLLLVFLSCTENRLQEVLSAYCGGGEIIRYDVDDSLGAITAKKLHQLSGSGEESIIADVDNDDRNEIVLATGKGDRTMAGTSYVVLVEKKE